MPLEHRGQVPGDLMTRTDDGSAARQARVRLST